MLKLSNQRNILIYGFIFLILYGVYYLHIEPKMESLHKSYKGKQSPEIQAFMDEVDKSINASGAVIDASDPFYKARLYDDLISSGINIKTVLEEYKAKFTYSGYIQAGEKELAIINNTEYQTGDTLEEYTGLYVLKSIYPSRVIIGDKAENNTLEILLSEVEN
jgi:hypothetical protein